MRLPRYWAKGSSGSATPVSHPETGEPLAPLSCWGWSEVSLAEAEERGRQRAVAVEELLRQGKRPDSYHYGDRPMREEIIDEWRSGTDAPYAAVTLNSYGCQVLNTAAIMFVDVDLPEDSAVESLSRGLKRLFGRGGGPTAREARETAALERVRAMVRGDIRCGVRAYRTRGGLRYLMTSGRWDPKSAGARAVMDSLGADPLYVRMCRTQECFRARLTPKPWRCGVSSLGPRYPWRDKAAEAEVRAWTQAYAKKVAGFATCALIAHLGASAVDPEAARVVELHDAVTKAGSGLPLA